jgi:hypothetical protein
MIKKIYVTRRNAVLCQIWFPFCIYLLDAIDKKNGA